MTRDYYHRLDILRVLSCFLVLFYHLDVLKGGFLAVCMFFVLSGYLTTVSALNKEDFSLKNYYINRLKRLYIPMLIVVSITVILAIMIPEVHWMNLKPESLSVLTGTNNFWQINANQDYFTRNINSPFIHFWYISILIQLDILFPLLFLLLKKINKKYVSIGITLLLTVISTGYFLYLGQLHNMTVLYYNTLGRSFSYLAGMSLGYLHHFHYIKRLDKYQDKLYIGYILLFLGLVLFIPGNTDFYSYFLLVSTIISLRLIDYSLYQSNENKYSSFFSNISYEIYLVQYPILFFVSYLYINSVLKILLCLALTIGSAYIIHTLIDRSYKNLSIKNIETILLSSLMVAGLIIVGIEKDHTAEMNALKESLNDSLREISDQNESYTSNEKEEKEEWNQLLNDMKDGEKKIPKKVKNLHLVGVGDSVLFTAMAGMKKTFPHGYFDAKVSRNIPKGQDVIKELKSQGKLGHTVLICLGTNGDYADKKIENIIKEIGNREIYWVNTVNGDDKTFNKKFEKYVKKYKNVHIVRWDKAAKNHPEYFYADGIHVKGTGVDAYAKVIYDTICDHYLEEYKKNSEKVIHKHDNEEKKKMVFYGNDILTSSFKDIHSLYPTAKYHANDYIYESLYKDLGTEINNHSLAHKVIILLDKQLQLTDNEWTSLIQLCKDHELSIIVTYPMEPLDNIKILNLYESLEKDDYLEDGIHLSDSGISKLTKEIKEFLK